MYFNFERPGPGASPRPLSPAACNNGRRADRERRGIAAHRCPPQASICPRMPANGPVRTLRPTWRQMPAKAKRTPNPRSSHAGPFSRTAAQRHCLRTDKHTGPKSGFTPVRRRPKTTTCSPTPTPGRQILPREIPDGCRRSFT